MSAASNRCRDRVCSAGREEGARICASVRLCGSKSGQKKQGRISPNVLRVSLGSCSRACGAAEAE